MKPNPGTLEKLERFANDWEMFGPREAARHALVYLLSRPRDDFDHRYGVSTAAIVPPSSAEITDPVALKNAIAHVPITEATFRHVMRHIKDALDPATLTFVDLGCGRGRAVLMAAELPFIEVVGVEISPSHLRVAERNIALVTSRAGTPPSSRTPNGRSLVLRSSIRLRCTDVARFDFPATDLLVYMFCPFRGETLQGVLDRLAAIRQSTRRNVYVVLCGLNWDEQIEHHGSFEKQHEFRVIADGRSWSLWSCEVAANVATEGTSSTAPLTVGNGSQRDDSSVDHRRAGAASASGMQRRSVAE